MKRIVSLFAICLVFITAFTACNKTGKLEGKWSADHQMFTSSELDSSKYPFIKNTVCTYSLTFLDDGTFAFSRYVSKDQQALVVQGFKELEKETYKKNHTQEEIDKKIAETKNCNNYDELIDQLLLNAAQAKGFSSVAELVCNEVGISNGELYRGEYKVKGSKITLTPSAQDAQEITARYEKDTITMTFDEVAIVFSPVSLDKDN